MSEKANPQPKRRGRKPLGDRAMTVAERKRASRIKQSQAGSTELMLRLSGGTLEFVDAIAHSYGTTRADTVELLLDLAISKMAKTMVEWDRMTRAGASEQEATAVMARELSTTPTADTVDHFKELLGIRA